MCPGKKGLNKTLGGIGLTFTMGAIAYESRITFAGKAADDVGARCASVTVIASHPAFINV